MFNTDMVVWPENTRKIITILADADVTVNAYSKKRGSSMAFEKINEEFTYMNDGVWEATAEFEAGEYILKYVIGTDEVLIGLMVVSQEKYDDTINQELIRTEVDKLLQTIIAKNSFKVSG